MATDEPECGLAASNTTGNNGGTAENRDGNISTSPQKTLESKKDENKDILISVSMLNLFRNCRRAVQYRYIEGLESYGKPKALLFGTIIHKCLDVWHLSRDFNKVLEVLHTEYDSRYTDAYEADAYLKSKIMMYKYAARWNTDDFEIVYLEKEIISELFDMDTLKPFHGVKFVGRIDGLVKQNGKYYLLEHKTTSKIADNYQDRLWADMQITAYVYYVSRVLKVECSGVYYNLLNKTNLKRQEGETEEEFLLKKAHKQLTNKTGKSRIKQKLPESDSDFESRLTDLYSKPEMFKREVVDITKARQKLCLEQISELVKSYISAINRKKFYQNTDYCFRYFSPCPFYSICKSSGNQHVINTQYKKKLRNVADLVLEEDII